MTSIKQDWRSRLEAAYLASGRSKRDVSLAAGLGPNYLREVLAGKSATVENLIALAAVLNIGLGELTDQDVIQRARKAAAQ